MLLALGIEEIGDRGELGFDFLPVEESTIGILLRILCVVFLTVFHIDIAHNVITKVINDNHILNLPILHHLVKNFLIEVLAFGHGSIGISAAHVIAVDQGGLDCIVLVHVLEAYGLADGRLVVDSLAAVAVPACAHLVEKWTIYLVHLCAVDFGESVSH